MRQQTCAQSEDEHLYSIEIFVAQVSLYFNKVDKLDPTVLGVDLRLTDFPLFRIFQADFELTKGERSSDYVRDSKYHTVLFNAGKIHLFPATVRRLFERIKKVPVAVDVYKVKGIEKCPEKVIKEVLGEAEVPLSGCTCDFAMSSNYIGHLAKPYYLENTYGLVDEDGKPSGVISLFLRIRCYGKFICNGFAIADQIMLFKTYDTYNEFKCSKVPLIDETLRREIEMETKACLPNEEIEESELDSPPKPRNVIYLSSVCSQLAKTNGNHPESEILQKKLKVTKEKVVNTESSENPPSKNHEKNDFLDLSCVCHEGGTFLRLFIKDTPCNNFGCGGGLCVGSKMLGTIDRNHNGSSMGNPCYTGSCCSGKLAGDNDYHFSCKNR